MTKVFKYQLSSNSSSEYRQLYSWHCSRIYLRENFFYCCPLCFWWAVSANCPSAACLWWSCNIWLYILASELCGHNVQLGNTLEIQPPLENRHKGLAVSSGFFQVLVSFFFFFLCCFVFSFLELKEKSARTAETLLSMLILISRVLAEALSDRLSPGTLHNVFSQLFTNKTWCWSQD